MRVTPISEEEAESQSSGLWPDGEYDYEIKEASEETSRAGNDMIRLQVNLYDQKGRRCMVFDYLINSEKSAWKLRKFAASCGLLTEYERGDLDADQIVGRTGRCKVGTQKSDGDYPAKNVIRDYLKAARYIDKNPTRVMPKKVDDDLDDSIPF